DLLVKSARELHAAARLVAARSLAALPWSGERRGPAGMQKAAAQLAAGGAVGSPDPRREGGADGVLAGAGLRAATCVLLRPQACGNRRRQGAGTRGDGRRTPPMPGEGDRHGTAAHVSVDLAAGTGTGVSAHERAGTVRRLAHPDARPDDFLRPGHVFPLAARPE